MAHAAPVGHRFDREREHHTRLLHDGRARTIAEAILWHGGEGLAVREEFRKMSWEEREALLRFLESL